MELRTGHTVYGIPVSGLKADGWLVSSYRTGPHWLSGGEFGAEASVVALALCLLGSAALLWLALRRGSMMAPGWRRGRLRRRYSPRERPATLLPSRTVGSMGEAGHALAR